MRTMLDYDNLKLRERTFLDFTDDEAIIGEIIGDKEFFFVPYHGGEPGKYVFRVCRPHYR